MNDDVMGIISSPLGLALGPNNTSEVVTDHPFRLTMAALDIDGKSIFRRRNRSIMIFF